MKRQSGKAAGKAGATERKPNAGAFKPGDERINRTIPGPGRPTDRFKRWCRKMVSNPRTKKAVRRILKDDTHPAFKAMWSAVAEHGHGKPQGLLEVSGKLTLEQLVSQANSKEA